MHPFAVEAQNGVNFSINGEELSDLQICFHEIKHKADVRFVSKGIQQLKKTQLGHTLGEK